MEISPLKTVDEVLNWRAASSRDESIPRRPASDKYIEGSAWSEGTWRQLVETPFKQTRDRPRTLVCHDMMGNYLEDRFIDGTDKDGYYFSEWAGVDIFVYFSHEFVTIPPPGWIAAAKLHGVKILGTIITENADGAQRLEAVLTGSVSEFVDQCVRIADHHGFDGWLLNVENSVDTELIPNLFELVEALTKRTKDNYSEGMVLWYDSVTKEGDLVWQNELNQLNKPFFDRCDGIFLNYNWKVLDSSCSDENPSKDDDSTTTDAEASDQNEQKKEPPYNSLSNSLLSLENDSRRRDIFVGVDVFGRGCYGGGGFNCNLAMEKIREEGLSAAIFAPGWTYEMVSDKDNRLPEFKAQDLKFWSLLHKYLYFRPTVSQLPFSTSFSSGRGPSPPWYNLKKMEIQPSRASHYCSPPPKGHVGARRTSPDKSSPEKGEKCVVNVCTHLASVGALPAISHSCHVTDAAAYRGSQSLYISVENLDVIVPLFLADIELKKPLKFELVTSSINSEEEVEYQLVCSTSSGQEIVLDQEEDLELSAQPTTSAVQWSMKGFCLEANSADTVEKIGIKSANCRQFYIGQFSILAQ